MSNDRSPRAVCSTTIGTSGIRASLAALIVCNEQVAQHRSRRATIELRFRRPRRPRGGPMTDTIEREIELPATVQDVWQAVTDADALSEWLADEVSLDLRPGGEARFVSGDEIRRGWVEEIAPPVGQDAGSGRLALWRAVEDERAPCL